VIACICRFIICRKPAEILPALPQATKNSNLGMLNLSLNLNHLLAWASTVFTIGISSKYYDDDNPLIYLLIVCGINAGISCMAGFWISNYMIRNLEETLSDQILSVFA
jgi:hypothetical protein